MCVGAFFAVCVYILIVYVYISVGAFVRARLSISVLWYLALRLYFVSCYFLLFDHFFLAPSLFLSFFYCVYRTIQKVYQIASMASARFQQTEYSSFHL